MAASKRCVCRATTYGWRAAFIGVGAASMVLVVLYPMVVRDYKTVAVAGHAADANAKRDRMGVGDLLRGLFAARSAVFTYLGSGLQMFILGVMGAWMPSYLARAYELAPDR